jgi:hypothetical protein
MRKRFSLKTRRPDLSREAFRSHYEGVHVPLGLTFIEHFRWRRYRRNHVLSSHGVPIGFDCYAEFWVDDDEDDSALTEFVQSPEFQVLNEDDARFLDVRQRVSFDARETTLAGSPEDPKADVTLGIALRDDTTSSESARDRAHRLVETLGEHVVSATLDERLGDQPTGPPPAAPFDLLLRLQLEGELRPMLEAMPVAGDGLSVLVLDPVETARELLYSGPGA